MLWLILSTFSAVVYVSSTTPSSTLECGACMMIISECEKGIGAVDPSKTIDVGSFRVSPTGEQKGLEKKSYSRSEAHLVELIESVCEKSKEYALVTNTITGKGVYVNKASTFLKGDESAKLRSRLHSACNDFIDANDDELVRFLKADHENALKEYCQATKGVCTSVDVTPLPPNDPPRVEPVSDEL